MSNRNFAAAALLLSLTFIFGAGTASAIFIEDELRVFKLVNQERARRGLSALQWDDRLADLARSYSEEMSDKNFFDHFDRQGLSVVDRARKARIKNWDRIGENLFFCEWNGQYTSLAIRGWLRSPTHRDNMLDPGWTATGIGIARSRSGEIFMTEVFIED